MASFSNFKSTIVSASNTAAGVTTGVTVYSTRNNLPISGNSQGDQAYVTGNNRLYIWNGSGWYNVALLNVAPSIQSVLDSDGGTTPFALSTEGTATTITITATDSDGDPVTYGYSADSDFSGLATISQDSSVFTITPFSPDSATTSSGTITFTATDGINVGSSGVQTFTLNFLSSLWDETVLSIGTSSTNSLDNSTYIDRSGNESGVVNRYGTGDTQSAFHPYLDNWSVELDDGATGSVKYNYNSAINMGTGDFTVEVWCYATNLNTHDAILNIRAGDSGYGFLFRKSDAANSWECYTGNGSPDVTYADSANPLGAWVHHAFVRINGTLKWYINGVEELSQSNSATWSTYTQVQIGNYNTAYTWPGYISNLRIVKGTGIYTAAFTPPTEKLTAVTGTVLLACNGNRIDAAEGTYDSAEVAGTAKISAFNPFGQESEYAVGENKGSVEFTTADGIDLEIRPSGTTTTYTIELWYKWDNATTINGNHYLLDARGTAGSQTAGSLYVYRNSTTTYSDGSNIGITDGNFNDGSWHHFVMVCDGTDRSYWIDGTRVSNLGGTPTIGTHLWINSRQTDQYHNASNYADVRVSSTARYATSSTTISVPTAPVGYDGNTTAYYPMDNAGIFDKTGNYNITPVGDAATSTTQTKYSTTSMYFDGTGDYIQIPDDDKFELIGDFTIEFWAYSTGTATTGYQSIIGGNGSGSNGWNIYATQGTGVIYFFHSSMLITSSSGDFPANQWNHVAVTRSGSDIKMFVNGTQVGSTASSSATLNQSTANAGTRIGYDIGANGYYTGYLENLQILNGVAKYTATFTPPTSTQGRTYQASS